MPEIYIPLENAAQLESTSYHTLQMRWRRTPDQYKTRTEPREDGGKSRVLVAVSSLSAKARSVYTRTHKTVELLGEEITMSKVNDQAAPWYTQVDSHWYIQNYPKQYEQGRQLAELIGITK